MYYQTSPIVTIQQKKSDPKQGVLAQIPSHLAILDTLRARHNEHMLQVGGSQEKEGEAGREEKVNYSIPTAERSRCKSLYVRALLIVYFAWPPMLNSILNLQNVRVVQRNLVYVVGLPMELCYEELLSSNEYIGQYGKIVKVRSLARTITLAHH